MSFEAKIIEHSIAVHGKPLVTYQLQYPRFIHAELMTHRVFSRNASSSRAIPVNKMIERTLADPAFFVHVGKNQPGMQAKEEVSDELRAQFELEWSELAKISCKFVDRWANKYGIHKQVANRAIEPWQHMSVILTTTELDNWFDLRYHTDAQPEIFRLAALMHDALDMSVPVVRERVRNETASWHLPYITWEERMMYAGGLNGRDTDPYFLAKISAARCARVSYLTHEGKTPSIDEDLALYERLVGGVPLHASPIEHQAYPLPLATQRSNNFLGWRQNRELVEDSFKLAK